MVIIITEMNGKNTGHPCFYSVLTYIDYNCLDMVEVMHKFNKIQQKKVGWGM